MGHFNFSRRRDAREIASGSRSIPIMTTVLPNLLHTSSKCPPPPKVPSTKTSPALISRPSMLSCKRTVLCCMVLQHSHLAQFFRQCVDRFFGHFLVIHPRF